MDLQKVTFTFSADRIITMGYAPNLTFSHVNFSPCPKCTALLRFNSISQLLGISKDFFCVPARAKEPVKLHCICN